MPCLKHLKEVKPLKCFSFSLPYSLLLINLSFLFLPHFLSGQTEKRKEKMELFNTSARNILPIKLCTRFPANIHSVGLWNKSDAWQLNYSLPFNVNFTLPLQNYTMPVFEVEMLAIFCLTQISHFFLKMIGLPMFVAELLVRLNCLLFFSSFN